MIGVGLFPASRLADVRSIKYLYIHKVVGM